MRDVALIGGTVLGTKLIEYLWCKFVTKAIDTDYVTVAACKTCEKHAEDEASVEDLRRELRAVKDLLLIMAEKQGIKPTELKGIMK